MYLTNIKPRERTRSIECTLGQRENNLHFLRLLVPHDQIRRVHHGWVLAMFLDGEASDYFSKTVPRVAGEDKNEQRECRRLGQCEGPVCS